MSHSPDLIINFTPTGMIPVKATTPYVPISPNEIIDDVLQAVGLGITIVHLHARDQKTEAPMYQREQYAKIISGIRKHAPELVICTSLSGRNVTGLLNRADSLFLEGDLKPDMASLTLSSHNFHSQASINQPDIIQGLARLMAENEVLPELEVFDLGMINYAKYLIKKELISPPYYFNIMLGNIAGAQANPLHAGVMIQDLPEKSYWAIGALGAAQTEMNALAVACGGGVRVGIEDNIWYDSKKTKLASNIDMIRRVHQMAELHERKIMKPMDFRNQFRLRPAKRLSSQLMSVPA